MITSEAYWTGPEPAGLCNNIAAILQGVHGPPTITPMPTSNPCSETIKCDPALYNRAIATAYDKGVLFCVEGSINLINDANPYVCDATNSGLFMDGSSVPMPVRAVLCYNNGT